MSTLHVETVLSDEVELNKDIIYNKDVHIHISHTHMYTYSDICIHRVYF